MRERDVYILIHQDPRGASGGDGAHCLQLQILPVGEGWRRQPAKGNLSRFGQGPAGFARSRRSTHNAMTLLPGALSRR
jgi:hypothetical protein